MKFFRENFINCIKAHKEVTEFDSILFQIKINWDGNEDSIDDIVKLHIFNNFDKKFANMLFSFEDAIKFLDCFPPYLPLWIHISEQSNNQYLLEFSSRYRKPHLLFYKELGYSPFKYIEKYE